MHWTRSYPSVPEGRKRAFVYDPTPNTHYLRVDNYDYTPLGEVDDDVLLIEWDMAASKEDMELFAEHAKEQPGAVLVAPHKLYHVAPQPVWAHRAVWPAIFTPADEPAKEEWIDDGDPDCDLFAFGMIYLPHELVRQFLAAEAPERGRPPWVKPGDYADRRFTDQTFSMWHYKTVQIPVKIDWDVRPIHLHYTLAA